MKKLLLIGTVPFFLLTGCMEKEISNKEVKVYNADGDSIGTVKLKEQADGMIFFRLALKRQCYFVNNTLLPVLFHRF